MNKKNIIILTTILSLGGGSSVLVAHYHSKKQNSLEVKSKKISKSKKKKKQNEKNKEEVTNISWTCTWKEAVCSLLICILISAIIAFVISYIRAEKKNLIECAFLVYFPFFLIIFEDAISPFVLAFKKFGKRSCFQHLSKTYSIYKIIIDVIVFVAALVLIILEYIGRNTTYFIDGIGTTEGPLEYLKFLFCCCCIEQKKENLLSASQIVPPIT